MSLRIAHTVPVFAVVMLAGAAVASPRNGHVNVYMSGGSAANVTAVLVTVERVDAKVDNRWVTLMQTPVEVNLMEAGAIPALLASVDVPQGRYHQLRLRLSNAQVEDATGTHPAQMPSCEQSGLKVDVNFRVTDGGTMNLLVSLDVARSLHRRGNGVYALLPVMRAGTHSTVGTVTGWTSGGGSPLAGVHVEAVYVSGGAQPSGTVLVSTDSGPGGTFSLGALPTGTYEMRFSYSDSSGHTYQTVFSVAIAAGMNTDLGEVTLF